MAPVVLALRQATWARVRVLATAQHREMLVLKAYDPALFDLLARVYPDHRIPMDVYHAKNIKRRPSGAR